ncbi:MAG: hypothetical protein ACPGVD_03515 [Flavobacteriales bacterium]
MQTKLKYLIICTLLLISFSNLQGQGSSGLDIQPLTKFIIKTNFRIPFATHNPFFSKTAEGVVEMSGSLNYSPLKNFYVGAGYKYTYYKLSEIKLNASPNERYNAKIQLPGFYGELSYFFPVYDNFLIEGNLQMGQESILSTSQSCISTGIEHKKKGLFVTPNLNFHLLTQEAFFFYFSLGYTFSSHGLNPSDLCETEFSGFGDESYNGNYNSLNVGFGIGISIFKSTDR